MVYREKRRIARCFTFTILSILVAAGSPIYGETFSFVVIADPHMSGSSDHKAKFETTVDWIIRNKDCKEIELTFVLGDIAWGGSKQNRNLHIAKTILDRLHRAQIPYIPIIGDNEIQGGCEKEFHEIFAPHYQRLAGTLDHWRKSSVPVADMYLQNFSFDYKGCHFVCPDFNPRKAGNEGGDLHDFEGGSWRWFMKDIQQCRKSKKENINIMTHIGMFRTGIGLADEFVFSDIEMEKIKRFLHPYRENVDSNYAGHLHVNGYVPVWSKLFVPLYHVRITDETWSGTQWPESQDPGLTVRWVRVDNSGPKISYCQNIEDISR
ncbi:MAG: metallophosphoesterase [Sedimentisphaerales bacterium]|nr:metallophosphoesterase [Sedimentisphaerales bacterium]